MTVVHVCEVNVGKYLVEFDVKRAKGKDRHESGKSRWTHTELLHARYATRTWKFSAFMVVSLAQQLLSERKTENCLKLAFGCF